MLELPSGVQQPSKCIRRSQLWDLEPGAMEQRTGLSLMDNGSRTMEPENNLRVFERGSLASTNTGQPAE